MGRTLLARPPGASAVDQLLTPKDVQRLLDVHGLAPRRAAGQNFVVDPNTVRKIVRDARVEPDDEVLEIGPGLGSLTLGLAEVVRRVVAVEIDQGMVRALDETVGHLDNVEVVHADALRTDLSTLVAPGARLVANLPYNVATPLVFGALDSGAFRDLFVMVQREVGERWAASPGDPPYGAVSVKLALVADVVIVSHVPRTVFLPVPNVDSVTVRVTPRAHAPTGPARERIVDLIDAAFAARRKTLRNNLKRIAPLERVLAACRAAGIDPGARAETLDVADFGRLAESLDARG
ncbi:MAG TPA: 16S rRNA (adenine(1518)-N(6)/adenine(1519)-N(6))-dimethyltransferase RsmA [Nitriliruptorales bacterium]